MKVWREALGSEPPAGGESSIEDIGSCDEKGCVVILDEGVVASFIKDHSALAEDCARADLVVALFPVSGREWRACKALLIDRRSVWKRGAHAVYIGADGVIKLETVLSKRGRRPWTGNG